MKLKFLCKFLIAIVIFIVLIYILDFATFFTRGYQYSEFKQTKKIDWNKNIYRQFCPAKYWTKYISIQDWYPSVEFRDVEKTTQNDKSPIILFGGSYMHGDEITFEESFSYKLSKLTNRDVYNRAFSGKDPKFMLFQTQLYYVLKNFYILKEFNKEIDINTFIFNLGFDKTTTKNLQKIFKNEKSAETVYKNFEKLAKSKTPEYVFYTYMFDHLRRIQVKIFMPITIYREIVYKKEKNNNLILQDTFCNGYRISSLPSFFEEQCVRYKIHNKKDETLKLFELYIRKTKELLAKNNPNIKFIIINYKIYEDYYYDKIDTMFEDDKNIIVLDIRDYVSEKIMFSNPNINHPLGTVWSKAIPQFVEKFNL